VDYIVFTDAARFLVNGESPYERATYRYTPLLALLLTPNILLNPVWGKILFACADLLAAFLISRLIAPLGFTRKKLGSLPVSAKTLVCIWLFNPIVINVSTRGNAEALISVAVLSTLYFLQQQRIVLAGFLFGLSVHLKLYPIIYSLALVISIRAENPVSYRWISMNQITDFITDRRRCSFIISSVVSFLFLSGFSYFLYGYRFLHESLLYHIIRTDHRHNFSVYFYQMYLAQEGVGGLLGLTAFVPQLVLLLALTHRYAAEDIGTCICLQTVAFVALNKVCTVQYWVWYFALVPLCLARCAPVAVRWWIAVCVWWVAAVALWLFQAYRLEMLGVPTWIWLVGASAALVGAHMLFLVTVAVHTRNHLLVPSTQVQACLRQRD
jgi:phosphatidylinositol glycan class M